MALSFRSASDSTFDILSLIELFDTNFWEYYLFDLLGSLKSSWKSYILEMLNTALLCKISLLSPNLSLSRMWNQDDL
jgi:hypothetical protein